MTYDNWKLDVPPHYELPELHPFDCSDKYGETIAFNYINKDVEELITGLVIGYNNKSVLLKTPVYTEWFEYDKMRKVE